MCVLGFLLKWLTRVVFYLACKSDFSSAICQRQPHQQLWVPGARAPVRDPHQPCDKEKPSIRAQPQLVPPDLRQTRGVCGSSIRTTRLASKLVRFRYSWWASSSSSPYSCFTCMESLPEPKERDVNAAGYHRRTISCKNIIPAQHVHDCTIDAFQL